MSRNVGFTRALRHRPFVALWFGNTVSAFGDSLHRLALAWWVMRETGSGLAMGTVLACTLVPMVPFLLIGGALVDRFDRVRIMLISDVVRGLISGLIALLISLDQLELWHLYTAAVVFGSVDGMFMPAMQAIIPSIVPSEDLPSANSIRVATRQLANVIGPMLAAIVISVGSGAVAFVIDAATFAVSALSIATLLGLPLKVARDDAGQSSILADIRSGMAYARREPWLRVSIIAFFFINFASGPLTTVVLTYIVIEVNQWDATALGALEAIMAAGAVIGAYWLGRRSQVKRRGLVIYAAIVISGIGGLMLGLPIPFVVIGAIVFVEALTNAVVVLVWTNLMQDLVPEEHLGRVFSIDNAATVITMPLGMAVVGLLLDVVDISMVCVLAGGMITVAGVVALLHPKIREIK